MIVFFFFLFFFFLFFLSIFANDAYGKNGSLIHFTKTSDWFSLITPPFLEGKKGNKYLSAVHDVVLITIFSTSSSQEERVVAYLWFKIVMQSNKMSGNSQILIWRYSQTNQIISFVFHCFCNHSKCYFSRTNGQIFIGVSPN